MLNCAVDHILQDFYTPFLTRFRTYKIASPPQTIMTSKDDIKGFVSLKFLFSQSYALVSLLAVPEALTLSYSSEGSPVLAVFRPHYL